MVKILSLVLVLGSGLISCSTDGPKTLENSPSNLAVVDSSPKPTRDDLPGDEQFRKWQDDSFRPVLDKWIKGERIPEYVELERKDSFASNAERSARVKLLDVNGDGGLELVMQTACSTVGNCLFMLFQRNGDGYREILSASMVQRFKLRKTRSNKYYDFETSSHGSASSGGIAIYKYNGTNYKSTECFEYEYESTGKVVNGQSIMRRDPTLTPANCQE
ncbi:MAG: hypothetical protein ABL959_23150 [Pyrinomonadaceae bacterium]